MGNSKTISINTEDGVVVVRKMALRDYGQFLKALRELPGGLLDFLEGKDTSELKGKSNIEVAQMLFDVFGDNWEDLVSVLAVPTDQDAEFIGDLDLADSLEVGAAIIELNNYRKLFATVKKLLAQKQKQAQPTAPAKT